MDQGDLWVVLIGLLILGRYASSRSSWVWGGMIPGIVLIGSIVTLIVFDLSLKFSSITPFALYFFIHLSFWIDGRSAYQKRQQKELDKMSALDIR